MKITTAKLSQTVACRCGQTRIAVDAPNALRLVCYCKDCRGYYNTLNHNSVATASFSTKKPNENNNAPLDPWGGCDYTHVYASELKVIEGKENLEVVKIREKSMVKRVYAKCCYTPIFSMGGSGSCLLNTALVLEANKAPIQFRIMGRQALPDQEKSAEKRPSISWSVPLSWFWTMIKRMPSKEQKMPLPLEFPTEIKVLENFKEG